MAEKVKNEANGGLFTVKKSDSTKPGLIDDGLMINDFKNSGGRII